MANRRRRNRKWEALKVHRELAYLRSLGALARAKGKKKKKAAQKVKERYNKLQNLRPRKRPKPNKSQHH